MDWRPSSTFTLGNRIDVFANAGGQYTPWDTTIPVTVSDGQITIQLLSIANWTFINAIEIRAQGTTEIVPSTVNLWPSQTQQFTSRVADAANTAVAWPAGSAGIWAAAAAPRTPTAPRRLDS